MKFEEGIRKLIDFYFKGFAYKSLVTTDLEISLNIETTISSDCSHHFQLNVDCKTHGYTIYMFPIKDDYTENAHIDEKDFQSFLRKNYLFAEHEYKLLG